MSSVVENCAIMKFFSKEKLINFVNAYFVESQNFFNTNTTLWDFNKIIPIDENEEDNTGYDIIKKQYEKWGNKWIPEIGYIVRENILEIGFISAGAPPTGILHYLLQNKDEFCIENVYAEAVIDGIWGMIFNNGSEDHFDNLPENQKKFFYIDIKSILDEEDEV